jgi:hypothetical protein
MGARHDADEYTAITIHNGRAQQNDVHNNNNNNNNKPRLPAASLPPPRLEWPRTEGAIATVTNLGARRILQNGGGNNNNNNNNRSVPPLPPLPLVFPSSLSATASLSANNAIARRGRGGDTALNGTGVNGIGSARVGERRVNDGDGGGANARRNNRPVYNNNDDARDDEGVRLLAPTPRAHLEQRQSDTRQSGMLSSDTRMSDTRQRDARNDDNDAVPLTEAAATPATATTTMTATTTVAVPAVTVMRSSDVGDEGAREAQEMPPRTHGDDALPIYSDTDKKAMAIMSMDRKAASVLAEAKPLSRDVNAHINGGGDGGVDHARLAAAAAAASTSSSKSPSSSSSKNGSFDESEQYTWDYCLVFKVLDVSVLPVGLDHYTVSKEEWERTEGPDFVGLEDEFGASQEEVSASQ